MDADPPTASIAKKPARLFHIFLRACKKTDAPAKEIRIKWKDLTEDERTKYTSLYESEYNRITSERTANQNTIVARAPVRRKLEFADQRVPNKKRTRGEPDQLVPDMEGDEISPKTKRAEVPSVEE